jgi:hypothetical protein
MLIENRNPRRIRTWNKTIPKPRVPEREKFGNWKLKIEKKKKREKIENNNPRVLKARVRE